MTEPATGRSSMSPHRLLLLFALLSLPGCATYQPLPLPAEDGLNEAWSLAAAVPEGQAVILTDGVNAHEAAVIAVMLNPELKAQRKRLDVARAQLFATRLLPDPQISFAQDRPTSDGPGLVDALNATLNLDLLALLTRSSDVRSQHLAAEQVRLDIVWQEWQVAQHARLLFVRDRSEGLKLALLNAAVERYDARRASSSTALAEGNLTIDSAGPDLTALLDAASQLYQLRQQHNQTRHELHALLGLRPETAVDLEGLPPPPPAGPFDVAGMTSTAIANRPDLIALQAGYASQEARVRKAVLRFFPALGLSLNRARDTSGVYTTGLAINLTLPILAGNRGEVRIERATREQLWAEYQARLAQTRSDISQLAKEQAILAERRRFLQEHLPALERMVVESQEAYSTRDIDALIVLNLEFSLISKRLELLDVEQSLWEISIALDTIAARAPLD